MLAPSYVDGELLYKVSPPAQHRSAVSHVRHYHSASPLLSSQLHHRRGRRSAEVFRVLSEEVGVHRLERSNYRRLDAAVPSRSFVDAPDQLRVQRVRQVPAGRECAKRQETGGNGWLEKEREDEKGKEKEMPRTWRLSSRCARHKPHSIYCPSPYRTV